MQYSFLMKMQLGSHDLIEINSALHPVRQRVVGGAA
ncbi:hypothetical protein Marme_0429 [Marinomonas mediterranea MMB-1]|jgi:hypothetical protein|uniref:Uncharacterized protein n=1 Tax=Marinomonas mediterranea (strain ATCC 700492 / JCM 21426 / NBRC 103028 / MMB-1) TaxID=717774 RepID=F2JZE5_MARM1|nr:hypothetical protein Marme_0429 [Marinomonas mediterranea MMB-1]